MAKQYWVGEFFVDVSRNQISQHCQSQTLPPKALIVLTYLAENRGRVVGYEELMDTVWPSSVVTPNTLQRSIAQLRKALGENSKEQSIIKTHAKQGYSLECDVIWSDDPAPNNLSINKQESNNQEPENSAVTRQEYDDQKVSVYENSNDAPQPTEDKSIKGLYWLGVSLAFVVCLFAAVLFIPRATNPIPQLHLSDLRYVTATDDKEYGASYSPDGNHILYHRYYGQLCINDIWAKNVETLKEIKLTAAKGTYSDYSVSPDGKTMLFIQQEDCTKPVTQLECYRLMSLSFTKALQEPQAANEIIHCQNSVIRKPIWIDNQTIAMMQSDDQRWKIIRYSLKDKSSSILYEVEAGNIIGFDYSQE